MRTPAEIETLLRVMRSQGCTELQEPDLLLKVARDAKSVRPVAETMFQAPAEKRPESYDPEKLLEGLDDDVDPTEIEPDDEDGADAFLEKAAKAVEQRRTKGRR